MFAYDKTFDPKVVLGQYDLISRFSDFPLYLGTQFVYSKVDMFCIYACKVAVLLFNCRMQLVNHARIQRGGPGVRTPPPGI